MVLLSTEMASTQSLISLDVATDNALFVADESPLDVAGHDTVLTDFPETAGDEWLIPWLSGPSTGAMAIGMLSPGGDVLPDPEQEDIVITGRRPTHDPDDYNGVTGGTGGTGSSGGGSPSSGVIATAVSQHTQDCGTEDGAAVQATKHVMGQLPPDVSGPVNPMTTSAGNDWTKVEFGAVIVKNPDGSFGALNNMIYSSNQALHVGLPAAAGQPVQGLWHSHITRGNSGQQAIDRYPSPGDWNALARFGGKGGSVTDPSIWLTGPDKVTREFKLSERSSIESLGADQMKNGEGLAGRERTQSCG